MSSSSHIIALMYHRVDNTNTDPWNICVSPLNFEEQLRFLKNNFNILSINEVIGQVKTGCIEPDSICITFDDGYADNYVYALPLLEKYNCPATFFIATAFIGQHKFFWWDELEMILLHSKKLPCKLSLTVDGISYHYTINETELTTEQWQQHVNWKWYDTPPTSRCAVFLDIWEKLRPLPYTLSKTQINVVNKWAGKEHNNYAYRLAMNAQQLSKLAQHPLCTIGLHTHTHVDMKAKAKEDQLKEIINCKRVLKQDFEIESNYLSYPYGRYDGTTIEVIRESGIAACFTTEASIINTNPDLFKLGRMQVCNWNSKQLKHVIGKMR